MAQSRHLVVQSITFPLGVQAVIVLVKYMDISRMRCIMAAFGKPEHLLYNGDTLQFQSYFNPMFLHVSMNLTLVELQ